MFVWPGGTSSEIFTDLVLISVKFLKIVTLIQISVTINL